MVQCDQLPFGADVRIQPRPVAQSLAARRSARRFIGDIIEQFEQTGSHTFLLGFEESYGYLGATFVRDKDAVMAALLVADAVAYYKAQDQTLWDALERVWQRYGYYQEATHDVKLEGRAGQERLGELMASLRRDPPVNFGPLKIAYTDDYASGVGYDHEQQNYYQLALGRSNVLHYRFPLGGFVMVRPSGTEPKLKIYFSVTGASETEARERLYAVRFDTLRRIGLM
jgi:phosphoglucomutase